MFQDTLGIVLCLLVLNMDVIQCEGHTYTFDITTSCEDNVPATSEAYQRIGIPWMLDCYRECGRDLRCTAVMFDSPGSCYLYNVSDPTCDVVPSDPSQKIRLKRLTSQQPSNNPPTVTTDTPTTTQTTCLNNGTYDTGRGMCECIGGFIGATCERYMIDCTEGYEQWYYKNTGYDVFKIQPPSSPAPFDVQCNMNDTGGTIFMKNTEWAPAIARNLGWQNYKDGFGYQMDNHWLGLDKLHYITTGRPQKLYMEVFSSPDYKGRWRGYENFRVANEADEYRMTYSGTFPWTKTDADVDPTWSKTIPTIALGDSMIGLNGSSFSTFDSDNDGNWARNCAADYKGGWWYGTNCAECNPNGLTPSGGGQVYATDKVFWHYDYKNNYIPFVEMMLLAM